MTPFFTLFGRQIPLYGLFFYIGLMAAVTTTLLICRRKSIPRFEIAYSGIYTMIGAVFGAKLLFIVVSFRQIIEESIPFEAIIKGGFVFYGGVIGGILGLLIYVKQFRMSIHPFLEIYSAVLPLGHAFGRIGCFFAGCCYGVPYDGPLAHTYQTSIGNTPTHTPLLPIQLLESFLLFLLFTLLLVVYLKDNNVTCTTTVIYTLIYPPARFIAEFWRGDPERGYVLNLSVSQWISIFAFIVSISFLATLKNNKKPL